MKPFNATLAMSGMPVVTAAGHPAEYLGTAKKKGQQEHAFRVKFKSGESSLILVDDEGLDDISRIQLVMKTEKLYTFVNVYLNYGQLQLGTEHDTEQEAKEDINKNLEYLFTQEISYEL